AWRREARTTLPGTALLAQLVEHLHGKEGVDGSSPSEGSAKSPEIGHSCSGGLARTPACGEYGALYGALTSRSASRTTQVSPVLHAADRGRRKSARPLPREPLERDPHTR